MAQSEQLRNEAPVLRPPVEKVPRATLHACDHSLRWKGTTTNRWRRKPWGL